jgi:CubicO group peptidase (beta-lactamase class C family)
LFDWKDDENGRKGNTMRKSVFALGLALFSVFLCCQKQGPDLVPDRLDQVGLSKEHLGYLDDLINEAVRNNEFPGADVLVGRKGRIVYHKIFGNCQLVPESRPMNSRMLFDLASMTKPVATATSVMILVERGKIRLWDKVNEFVPQFEPYVDKEGQPSGDACLWHLLTHTSGLPPYCEAEEVIEKYSDPCPVEQLVEHIGELEKLNAPGEDFHYSCLGFITLAFIIKKVSGENVADFARENIFEPLGMIDTCFKPGESMLGRCVPTEVIDGSPLVGIVHDPLARLQGGISGNAGLFSTADDLALFAKMLLNGGQLGKCRILSPLTVDRMTAVFHDVAFSGRGLGWDIDSSYSTNGGDLFGPRSFGHTGYTGTSIWIDPETETFVIFLTNRVHPDDSGSVTALRSKVANVVAASILMKEETID